jgi:hypothetical protein
MFESLTERLIVALVSAIVATLTLAMYPLAILFLGRGGGELELGAHFYAFLFSKSGLMVIVVASIVGFCVGSERMANIFSFFWGTHSFWARLDDLQTEHNLSHWVLVVLLVIFAVVMVAHYA